MPRYGVAFRECVDADPDTLLRALDERRTLPHVLPVWCRKEGWPLDPWLLRQVRERGVEPAILATSASTTYERILAGEHDTQLRLLACRADGCVIRWDQEATSKGLSPPWYRHPLYVEVFGYVSTMMRSEADVRLAYCSTTDLEGMAEFYPGDVCQVVGFDAFSRKADGRFPPEQWKRPIETLRGLAPGKPVWVFECGRQAGLPRRVAWLRSIADVEVDVAIPWDMDVPSFADDFTWTPAMHKAFAEMLNFGGPH